MSKRNLAVIARVWAAKQSLFLVLLLAVFLIGSIAIAQTTIPHIKFEAEGGNAQGIITKSDTTASGGQYVEVGAISETPFPMSPNEVGVIGAGLSYSNLTIHNGDFTTTQNGQVIERMDIRGRLMVRHNNVTLRKSRVMYTTNYGLDIRNGNTGTVVEDSEFNGSNLAIHGSAGYDAGAGFTLRRVYLHNAPQGFISQGNSVIEDSYLIVETDHPSITGEHREAVLGWGANHTWLRNTFICSVQVGGCSGAAVLYGDPAVTNVLVQDNYFASAAAYCSYAGANHKFPSDTANVRFINNAFDRRLQSEGGWKYSSDTNNNKCGQSGDVATFDSSGPGNIMSGNYYWPDLLPLGTPEP